MLPLLRFALARAEMAYLDRGLSRGADRRPPGGRISWVGPLDFGEFHGPCPVKANRVVPDRTTPFPLHRRARPTSRSV